jgi:hypothetical protein
MDRFWPGPASVMKNICPTAQFAGREARVPDFTGEVLPEPVKSIAAAAPLDRNGPRIVIPPFTVS